MKLYAIHNAREVLNKLSEHDGLTIRECYALNRILKDAATDIAFYAARYNKLLAAYGEEQEHGRYQIPEDKQEAFHKAVEELMNTESETRFSPVEISGELTGFTPKEVALLDPFIKIKE